MLGRSVRAMMSLLSLTLAVRRHRLVHCSSTFLWQLDLSHAADSEALQPTVFLAVFRPRGQQGGILGVLSHKGLFL